MEFTIFERRQDAAQGYAFDVRRPADCDRGRGVRRAGSRQTWWAESAPRAATGLPSRIVCPSSAVRTRDRVSIVSLPAPPSMVRPQYTHDGRFVTPIYAFYARELPTPALSRYGGFTPAPLHAPEDWGGASPCNGECTRPTAIYPAPGRRESRAAVLLPLALRAGRRHTASAFAMGWALSPTTIDRSLPTTYRCRTSRQDHWGQRVVASERQSDSCTNHDHHSPRPGNRGNLHIVYRDCVVAPPDTTRLPAESLVCFLLDHRAAGRSEPADYRTKVASHPADSVERRPAGDQRGQATFASPGAHSMLAIAGAMGGDWGWRTTMTAGCRAVR